jgi:hypothetical protein
VISVHGDVVITRCYRYCSQCDQYSFPVEVSLGFPKRYSTAFKRFTARCCGFWSYALSAQNLKAFCGIHLSPTKVGEIADEVAGEIAATLPDNAAIRERFQRAKGETEFYVDGTCVHVRSDAGEPVYCEMKVGGIVKRECSDGCTPEECGTRELQKPTVVSAFAAIESKEEFQKRCQDERRRLGVGGVTSALGDGALWIWSLVFMVFGKTMECLDVFHALEHVAACGKALYGSGQAFSDWFEWVRLVLLSEGLAGMERELSTLKDLDEDKQKAVASLLEYLRKHKERLHYAQRLAAGRSIGSGLIEGACKNLVKRRLRQTGACWRVPRANRIALICSTLYSEQWEDCWKKYH